MESAMEAKLDAFSETVLGEAKRKSDETDTATEAIRAEKTEKKHNEFLEDAYRMIQSAVNKVRRAESEKVLRAENEMKKDILKCRESIIDSVFGEVEKRLSDYTKSDEYKTYFKNKLSEAISAVGEGKKTVFVTERDLEAASECGEIVKAVSERGFIGGVRIVNEDKGIIADYSFGEALAEARGDFLQKSGLSIE